MSRPRTILEVEADYKTVAEVLSQSYGQALEPVWEKALQSLIRLRRCALTLVLSERGYREVYIEGDRAFLLPCEKAGP